MLAYSYRLRTARQYTPANIALREVREYVKKNQEVDKNLTWIKMIGKDLEKARVMVAKEDNNNNLFI